MTVTLFDFGKRVIPVQRNDAFFLDTNVILAYLQDDNPKHLAVYHFIQYLIEHEIRLFISETVAHEVVHVLARGFYAKAMIEAIPHLSSLSTVKRREHFARFERDFMKVTKQRPHFTPQQNESCQELLRTYHTQALNVFLPFHNEFCGFIPLTDDQLNFAFALCTNTPLHSSDAMIAAAAINSGYDGMMGIISLDRDMVALTDICVYYTDVRNHEYDTITMRTLLGLSEPQDMYETDPSTF